MMILYVRSVWPNVCLLNGKHKVLNKKIKNRLSFIRHPSKDPWFFTAYKVLSIKKTTPTLLDNFSVISA